MDRLLLVVMVSHDAVRAVLAGATATEVAASVGVSQQSLDTWVACIWSMGWRAWRIGPGDRRRVRTMYAPRVISEAPGSTSAIPLSMPSETIYSASTTAVPAALIGLTECPPGPPINDAVCN